MAAAYAALVSLSHILQQILRPSPAHHFIFPRERVESLLDTVSFLIDFLERFPSRRIREIEEDVSARIIDAAHEAEDIIEGNVVTQIQTHSADLGKHKSSVEETRPHEIVLEALHDQGISKVMETFVSIKRDLLAMDNNTKKAGLDLNSTRSSSSSTSLPEGKNIMVGFEEHLNEIKSGLSSYDTSLVIIPIVGMGGIGKTTLAKNVCRDPLIVERFNCLASVRVSQECKERDVVIALLQQINGAIEVKELSCDEVGVLLHKELFGRRYLIVLDDLWEIQAWDQVKRYLPDTNNGSRILVTTRLQNLAQVFGSGRPHQMTLLDKEKSWDLIHEYVKEDCPTELVEIGRSIASKCGGLPLALVAIGGLLAKSERSRDFWKHVERDVISTANNSSTDDEKCVEILRMSYNHLPMHLKPCFLYLVVFPKNIEIRTSRLIRLWVAEGFIYVKPSEDKILEEVARGYLKDLVDRNLVMMSKGKGAKKCNIHDLVRELCTNEAQKNKFLCIDSINNSRRLSIHTGDHKALNLRPGIHNRSLLSYSAWESRRPVALGCNLLRVLDSADSYSIDEIKWLTNSRYITCAIPREFNDSPFVFISFLWSLQTLVLSGPISLPSEFWQMPQLRHIHVPGISLSDPGDHENPVVLENLQTLTTVRDFTFSENVVKRIPNVKKLGIDCEGMSNMASLDKLESLVLKCRGAWENMVVFPISLKKLTLSHCQIPWEEMYVVGSLPELEALKLLKRAARGREWKPNAGEFRRLKFLCKNG